MISSTQNCCNEIKEYILNEYNNKNIKLSEIELNQLNPNNTNFCHFIKNENNTFSIYFEAEIQNKLTQNMLDEIIEIQKRHGF